MNGFTRACVPMLLLVLSALVPTAATAGRGVTCDDVINALGECNGGYACDDDLGNYFPGATRGALVAAESEPWFTRTAFDRHCLAICKAGTVDWEARDAEFKRDICGIGKPFPAKDPRPFGYVESYTCAAACSWAPARFRCGRSSASPACPSQRPTRLTNVAAPSMDIVTANGFTNTAGPTLSSKRTAAPQ